MHALPGAIGAGLVVAAVALPGAAAAQTEGPSARLAAWAPELFPAVSVMDATLASVPGAQIAGATERQRTLGLHEGDLVVAVDGQSLVATDGAAPAVSATPVLTVLRYVPGERPVLPPAVLGRQVFAQFTALPEAQQSPMRLARMLANQQMLVEQGTGVVLVPETANADDATWLTHANPMPAPWEDAVRRVCDAMQARATLPAITTSEAEAATQLLAAGEFLVARERAERAIMDYIVVPETRGTLPPFQEALALHATATQKLAAEQRRLTDPGGRFAVVVEPLFSSSATPLAQDILFDVKRSNDLQIAAGLNTSLHWPSPSGGWPVLRDFDLLVEYAYTPRSYEGPHGGDELPIGQGVEPPVTERMRMTEHRLSFELTYRPTLLSWLRPILRGGPAFFAASARSIDQYGMETMQVSLQTWGWVVGAGIDIYRHRTRGWRATVVGTVQKVEQEFCDDAAKSWEKASNIPQYKIDEMYRPPCASGTFGYKLETSAWQTGVMLAYEF